MSYGFCFVFVLAQTLEALEKLFFTIKIYKQKQNVMLCNTVEKGNKQPSIM